jgi:rod shape-determining protein MreC
MLKINNRKIIKYIAVIGLLVFLYALGLLGPLENVMSKILNPILFRAQSVSSSINQKYQEQTSRIDFAQTFNDQQAEINRLLSENAELKIIKEENAIMRQYLDYFSEHAYARILAGVISRGNITDSATRIEVISIDKGSNNGLYPGLVVINEEGIVIGKISEVKEAISEIELVLNDKCRIAATILGDDKTSGIVEGELGLTMKMGFIPQSKNIKKGDIVISSGLEELIPRGLVIGQVSKLMKENNELWQEAMLESSVDLDGLLLVSVLLP